MNTIMLGARNAFRNTTRAISIVIILGLVIALSMIMLVSYQAVNTKIKDVMSSIGNTVTIKPAGFSSFSQVNNALSTTQLSQVKRLKNVVGVNEYLTDRLKNTSSQSQLGFGRTNKNAGNTNLQSPITINLNKIANKHRRFFIAGGGSLPTSFSFPISIIGTTNTSQISGANIKIVSGSDINTNLSNNQVLVSSQMASKNNLHIGSTFTAYTSTLKVAGIFSAATRTAQNTILVSLPTEQSISNQSGVVTSATAYVDSLSNLSSTTSAIEKELGSSADVTSSVTQANNTVKPLNEVLSIASYSLIGSVIAGAVIILLVMVMIVRERRREIGILKAIGASNLRIIFQFMSEAFTFTILGAVVGLIIAVIGATPVTKALVSNTSSSNVSRSNFQRPTPGGGFRGGFARQNSAFGSISANIHNIHASVSWSLLIYGLLAALIIAIIGSALAGWIAAKISPSEAMKSE